MALASAKRKLVLTVGVGGAIGEVVSEGRPRPRPVRPESDRVHEAVVRL